MMTTRTATEVLDHDFLETRGKVLEVAAALDRLDSAPGRAGEHPDKRLAQLRQVLDALTEPGPGRAETIQLIFSDPYEAAWQRPDQVREHSNRSVPLLR